MRRMLFGVTLLSILAWPATTLFGFCGFYVSKTDTKLFNKASQVVLVRDGDRTVMTMANDFEGAPNEFAVVRPFDAYTVLVRRDKYELFQILLRDGIPLTIRHYDQRRNDG